jgi:hypothetical protein
MALDGATLVSGIVSAHLRLVLISSNLSEDMDVVSSRFNQYVPLVFRSPRSCAITLRVVPQSSVSVCINIVVRIRVTCEPTSEYIYSLFNLRLVFLDLIQL